MQRLKNRKKLAILEKNIRENGLKVIYDNEILKTDSTFTDSLNKMLEFKFNKTITEKLLNDFLSSKDRNIGKSVILTRTGPMLGLMGTLIPMGPALTGLASGDVASMASNMQVAFATTVVGIFTGGCGFISSFLSERWYKEDYDFLEYIAETAFIENKNEVLNEKK
ncbi:MAG: MotA/TolQ/ExbB proton channel family protein [Candidatus Muirbacterium halophilum]|nr:MotA/TolQ/ExbB proton channel family protein [Candidatus Muirbacterium halophilum]MCK9475894.1 MotA/TolQ/ExbB proton channel family protein [Candidatus Muirbacterium halophilum]